MVEPFAVEPLAYPGYHAHGDFSLDSRAIGPPGSAKRLFFGPLTRVSGPTLDQPLRVRIARHIG
jgi:hypothetical protein